MSASCIELRPHHALCTAYYTGHGYSEAFTKTMDETLAALESGANVRLVSGPDTLCAVCPNRQGTLCRSEEKVCRYDAAVLASCGWQTGTVLPYSEFRACTTRSILIPGRREHICGDCEWNALCAATPPRF